MVSTVGSNSIFYYNHTDFSLKCEIQEGVNRSMSSFTPTWLPKDDLGQPSGGYENPGLPTYVSSSNKEVISKRQTEI